MRNIPTEDLAAVIARARLAQRQWAEVPVQRRLSPVRTFRRLLVASCDRLCQVIGQDVGKTTTEVVSGDVLPAADACRFLERQAARVLRPRHIPGRLRPAWLLGQSDSVHRRPRGVVGIIGTWNYPLFLNGGQILQALAAGNAVVWKPSEVTPAFAQVLRELLSQAGFPLDLIQYLPATRDMGPALAEAAIDHVVFTGSAEVGRKLASRLGERLISSTLELSGCDAQFVLEDANVELAARAAWFGTTLNRGQTCVAVRRSLVQRRIYPAFCQALESRVEQARPVDLVLPEQLRQTGDLIADALEGGSTILGDGLSRSAEPRCIPTVVVGARPEMALCRKASFAPVMAVMPFDTLEEALELEGQCPFALGASIFTRDLSLAEDLARRLRAGAVVINDVIVAMAHPATPFGGRGASGWGSTQGAEGLLEMTVPQVVSRRTGRFRPHYELDDPRKLEAQGQLLRGMLEATHAPGLGQRLKGWLQVLRAAWRFL